MLQSVQHASGYLWLAGTALILLVLGGLFAYLLARRSWVWLKPAVQFLDRGGSALMPRYWSFVRRRFSRKTWYGLTLTGALAAFLLTTYVFAVITDSWMEEEALYQIDQQVHTLFADAFTPAFVTFIHGVTYFGDFIVAGVISGMLGVFFLYRKERWRLVALALVMGGGQAIMWSLKWIFSRARPGGGLTSPIGSSFPSGHTFTATVLYGFLIFLVWRYVHRPAVRLSATVLLSLIIMLVGLSRVLLSVHWVSDVLGGMTIGLAWLVCALLLTCLLQARQAHRARR